MLYFVIRMCVFYVSGGVDQVVMAMPHRGRVNLLASSLLNLPPVQIFQKVNTTAASGVQHVAMLYYITLKVRMFPFLPTVCI